MTEQWHPLCERIHDAQRILLICHVSPDGDTCGSALALRRALLLLGKQAEVCCADPFPRIYNKLCGAEYLTTPEMLTGQTFDLALCVDVSDESRMGGCAALFAAARHTAQIDHHSTNPGYAQVNVIRSPLSATGVLAAELIEKLGVALDKEMAECLYTAVTTDTGCFKQANTDEAGLQLGAKCVACGIDVAALTRTIFDLRPACQVKLFGAALSSLQLHADGRLATMIISREDFLRCEADPEHTTGIINIAFNTEGVEVAALLTEKGGGVKASMRCCEPYNVAAVAKQFGGGGHALAAGCMLYMPLEDARQAILTAFKKGLSA